jgi:hypothetical protein
VSERETQSGASRFDLRDAVLEATLRLATRHEEVALTKLEDPRPAASMRTEEKIAGLTQGHQSHHGVQDLSGNPIAMPSHAVSAVSIEVDPHGVELNAIPFGQCRTSALEPLVSDDFLLIELLPGGQPRFVDLAVVHPPTTLPPSDVTEQLFESPIRAGHPVLAMVHPGAPIECGPFEARERRIDDGVPVCP